MARGPRPQRVQTLAEIAMPREEFDELERRRKERWERGGDYYSDEEPEDDDREPGPQREETIETLAYLLSISKGAATALYDDQRIVDLALCQGYCSGHYQADCWRPSPCFPCPITSAP